MKCVFLIFVVMLVACAYDDPHQYFLRYQARQIGGSIDDFNKYQKQNSINKPIEEFALSNGNILAKYWYVRPYKNRQCIEIYEYDPITRKILKASFEGNQCIWNP